MDLLLTSTNYDSVTIDDDSSSSGTEVPAGFVSICRDIVDTIDFEAFDRLARMGKMNSAAYRLWFMKIAIDKNLSKKAISYVVFLCCYAQKRRERILERCRRSNYITATGADDPDWRAALQFIERHMINHAHIFHQNGRNISRHCFPVAKMPETFCSSSIRYHCCRRSRAVSVVDLLSRSFFGNMALSDFLQDLNEMFVRFRWTRERLRWYHARSSILDTSRSVATKKPTASPCFHDPRAWYTGTYYSSTYKNASKDSYPFYDAAGKFYEFRPGFTDTDKREARTIVDIVRYINHLRAHFRGDEKPIPEDVSTMLVVGPCWRWYHPAFGCSSENGKHQQQYDYDPVTGKKVVGASEGLLADLIASNPGYWE